MNVDTKRAGAFAATFLALTLGSSSALAEKVLVFPFHDGGVKVRGVTIDPAKQSPAAVEEWTRAGLTSLKHTVVAGDEEARARATVKDGVADTSGEFLEGGKLVQADFTIVGTAQATEDGVRVEVFACQLKTSRVESLARDIQGSNRKEQLEEMLALLVTEKGIGANDIAWKVAPKYENGEKPRRPEGETAPHSPATTGEAWAYGEKTPLSLHAGVSGYAAAVRPGNAVGDSATLGIEGAIGFAPIRSLELRVNFGASVAGPSSLHVDGGARYAFTLSSPLRLYAGPEVTLGAFVPLGGDKTPRFLGRSAGFIGIAIGDHAQVEAMVEFLSAPGGSGTLVLAGGSLRGGVRF